MEEKEAVSYIIIGTSVVDCGSEFTPSKGSIYLYKIDVELK